jgi:hypothetical protein
MRDYCNHREAEKKVLLNDFFKQSNEMYILQLVEGLSYKLEDNGFDSEGHWIFFNLPNPFSHTMVLGLTQSLTEISTRNFSGE